MFQKTLSALACAVLMAAGAPASAAVQDFVNGNMVGKPLLPLNAKFFGADADLHNKVVLVDFWGFWCEPCRHSMPELNKLHAELGGRGLVVLGMTRDSDKEIAEFITKVPMQFPIMTDTDGAIFKRLSVRAMPYAMLVDRTGNVIWQGDPGALKRTQIEAALNAPAGK